MLVMPSPVSVRVAELAESAVIWPARPMHLPLSGVVDSSVMGKAVSSKVGAPVYFANDGMVGLVMASDLETSSERVRPIAVPLIVAGEKVTPGEPMEPV